MSHQAIPPALNFLSDLSGTGITHEQDACNQLTAVDAASYGNVAIRSQCERGLVWGGM